MASRKGSLINFNSISNDQLYRWRLARWQARTDLGYLCREVLGMPDVSDSRGGTANGLHTKLLDILQKFPTPDLTTFEANDRPAAGTWSYTPIVPIYSLDGIRKTLILDFRGAMKTTINATAHTIQWILNYPDIAMMIVQSTTEKAESILEGIKGHFQSNPKFRALFPEHVPQKGIFDWGTKSEFTTEARNAAVIRREHTVMTGSVDKGAAGYHLDVLKFSDIVEENNTRTKEQIVGVIRRYGMMLNLRVGSRSWIDVEGTRYDFNDLYGEIIKNELKKPESERDWKIYIRGIYKKVYPAGYEPQFTIDEMEKFNEFAKDDKGQPVSLWPERFPTKDLEEMRRSPTYGEVTFATQQLLNPSAVPEDQQIFPVNAKYPVLRTREDFTKNVRVAYYDIAVDMAETVGPLSDFTALSVCAWDSFGRPNIVEIVHGKFHDEEIIKHIVRLQVKYKANRILLEDVGFTRGLRSSIQRVMDTTGVHLPINLIKREVDKSKKERIQRTLRPWYISGDLRFLDDIGPLPELKEELMRFPRSNDDILDTLSDLFQGKEWFGILPGKANLEQARSDVFERWLKIEPFEDFFEAEVSVPEQYRKTGGL